MQENANRINIKFMLYCLYSVRERWKAVWVDGRDAGDQQTSISMIVVMWKWCSFLAFLFLSTARSFFVSVSLSLYFFCFLFFSSFTATFSSSSLFTLLLHMLDRNFSTLTLISVRCFASKLFLFIFAFIFSSPLFNSKSTTIVSLLSIFPSPLSKF